MTRTFPDLNNPATRQSFLRKALQGVDFEPFFEVWRVADGGITEEFESGLLAVLYEILAERAVGRGEAFIAEELASRGRERAESVGFEAKRCFQLKALAYARSGATRKAADILMRLAQVSQDAESSGLLARVFRDRGWEEPDSDLRRGLFIEAYAHAAKSFARDPASYYNGIQAAQFAFLAGETGAVEIQLKQVEALCAELNRQDFPADSQEPFWINVTLAEAALIRGDLPRACERYQAMLRDEEKYPADTEATRRVAVKLIERHLSLQPGGYTQGAELRFEMLAKLRQTLCSRPVVIFSGHAFDCRRKSPRFPIERAGEVAGRMRELLARIRPQRAVFSLSLGADLLFAEEAIRYFEASTPSASRLGVLPLNAVLAYDREQTLSDADASLEEIAAGTGRADVMPDGDFVTSWRRRMEFVLNRIPYSCFHEAGYPRDGARCDAYAHANALLAGIAYLEAARTDAAVLPVVVDAGGAWETGGTGDFVESLHEESRRLLVNLFPRPVS